jgi:hypothetical protein
MPMKQLAMTLAVGCVALVLTAVALADATCYAGPRYWYPGQGAGSAWSTGWYGNHFSTYGSGYDKTVTFIDNQSYSWHNTVRNRSEVTDTIRPGGQWTLKGHCRAHDGYFHGSCWLRH